MLLRCSVRGCRKLPLFQSAQETNNLIRIFVAQRFGTNFAPSPAKMMQKLRKYSPSSDLRPFQQVVPLQPRNPGPKSGAVFDRQRVNLPRVRQVSNERDEGLSRRQRRQDAAIASIIDAAESFLKERSFKEMTVYEVMARTSLARSSFYEYFRDRYDLMVKVSERLGNSIYSLSERWPISPVEGNEVEVLKSSIDDLIGFYVENDSVVRAIAHAASHDPRVEALYRKQFGRFIEATGFRIRAHLASSSMTEAHPEEVAAALVLMTERYTLEQLTHSQNPQTIAVTLFAIWRCVLYGK